MVLSKNIPDTIAEQTIWFHLYELQQYAKVISLFKIYDIVPLGRFDWNKAFGDFCYARICCCFICRWLNIGVLIVKFIEQ